LPGHTYQDTYTGAAAFSPDGTAALVSPGGGLYLLDTTTGVIRATSSGLGGVVLNAGYGWNGRRIAVLTAPLNGMCVYSPHGGSVTILDPNTLLPIATPMIWPETGDESPGPGQLMVAADADLIVTSGLETYPASPPKAFRLSDGSPLPGPAIATFPLALSPDGTTALMAGNRALQLVGLADGASIASTAAAAPTAVAFSGDGSTVAAGSAGDNLLGIWRPGAGPLVPTCTADARTSDEGNVTTALSAEGATIAVDWGPQIRVLRRADGSTVSTIDHAGQMAFGLLQLSPDARYLIAEFYAALTTFPEAATMDFPLAVFRTADGARIADLGDRYSSGSFVFMPDGRRLGGNLASTPNALTEVDLETGIASPKPGFEGAIVGLSGDCPLLVDSNSTLVRACGDCQPLPVGKIVQDGTKSVVSLDGSMYLGPDGEAEVGGTVLWSIASQPGAVRTYPPRPEEASWRASEIPVAVGRGGGRVITGAQERASCSWAPGFTSRVHDVATDTIIDELPPHVTSTSADLTVIAYGPVLWCAR
jgi:WD40 repeat protein